MQAPDPNSRESLRAFVLAHFAEIEAARAGGTPLAEVARSYGLDGRWNSFRTYYNEARRLAAARLEARMTAA